VKSNPKSFYAYVRSKTSVKEVVGPLRDRDGKLVMESEGMCNTLNDFFASVFTKERQDRNYWKWRQGLIMIVAAC
jgi:hypothetical protein